MSWGAVAAGAVSIGSAVASKALKGKGGGGSDGQTGGYDVVTLPTYDFTEPRFRAMSDFVTQQFQSISQGGVPSWLANQLPIIRKGLNEGLDQTYYGLPGQRTGILPTAMSAAAITGAGGGVANRQVSRQLQNYAQQASQIDQFIASQTITGTQQTIRDAGSIGLGIPQGPPAQIVSLQGVEPQQGPSYAPATNGIAAALSGIINQYQGGQQQQPVTQQPAQMPYLSQRQANQIMQPYYQSGSGGGVQSLGNYASSYLNSGGSIRQYGGV